MARRLIVAQVMATAGGGMGGLEKHVLTLCAALAGQAEVHLVADEPYRALCPPGVHFHAVNFSRSRWNPWLYRQLAATLQAIGPDIIHAQAGKAATLLARLRRRWPRVPCVATVHGTKKDIRDYARMDGVIAVSRQLAERFPSERVRVIANGIALTPPLPPESVAAVRESLLQGRPGPLVVAVGRLAPVKAFEVLLAAFRPVDACLCIAGDGEEREALETVCREYGLQDRVRFLGQRSDIPALLRAADLCVISSHREGFPLVMVEALHAGCPLVSTAVSGVSEWLPPHCLTPPGDAGALGLCLTQALADLPALREAYQPVFARARRELTLDGMARQTLDFYDSLIDGRS